MTQQVIAERINGQKLESSSIKSFFWKNCQIWFCLVMDIDELDHVIIVQFTGVSGVAQSRYLNMH